MATTESKLGHFAEDLGRLLGTAEARAKGWLAQQHQIIEKLEGIRETASGLLRQLGNETRAAIVPRGSRSNGAGKDGRPKATVRKRRRMARLPRKAVGARMKKYSAARRKATR
jgi:hypothetical protein